MKATPLSCSQFPIHQTLHSLKRQAHYIVLTGSSGVTIHFTRQSSWSSHYISARYFSIQSPPPSPALTPSSLQPNDHSDQSLTAGEDRSEGKFNCVDTISPLFVPTKLSHYFPSLVFIPMLLHFRELTSSAVGN